MTVNYEGLGDGWIVDSTDPRLVVLWPGSQDQDVDFVLNVARIQCETFAPAVAEIPENYVAAQIMQARSLLRAGIVGDNDQMGYESVTVFPMDWTVKALLRPRRGKPYFGGAA